MASESSLVRSLPRAGSTTDARLLVAATARRLARLAFGATLVLSPLRAAFVLVSRPQPPIYAGYTDFTIALGELALIATLLLWAVSLAASPGPVSLGPGFVRWPAAGLLALVWLGVPLSIDPALSAFDAAQLLLMAAFAIYALNEIESTADLAWPLGLMIGLQSIVALGQFAAQRSLGLQWLGELFLDPRQNGVSVVSAAGTVRLLRAYGLTDHPNILGGLLAFGLLLLVLGGAWRGRRAVPIALVVALGFTALFATFSRAAWLAAGIGLAVGLAMLAATGPAGFRSAGKQLARVPRGRLLAAVALIAAVALLLTPFAGFLGIRLGLGGAASVTEEMSIGERTILAGAALSIAAGHLLLGTGLGTFPLALLRADPGLTFDFQPAHMVLLDVAAECGVLAATCYLALMVAPWVAALRAPRRWTRDLAAASAALAAVTVVGLLDYYTWTFAPGRIWAWLVLGLWAGAYARSRVRAPDAA